MTQRINDKLKKCCELCQSHLDKPCAWLSLGNEYCDTIMEVQADIEIKDKVIDEILSYMLNEVICEPDLDYIYGKMNNCCGAERNWTRGDKEELKMLKQYFYKKVGGEDE